MIIYYENLYVFNTNKLVNVISLISIEATYLVLM